MGTHERRDSRGNLVAHTVMGNGASQIISRGPPADVRCLKAREFAVSSWPDHGPIAAGWPDFLKDT